MKIDMMIKQNKNAGNSRENKSAKMQEPKSSSLLRAAPLLTALVFSTATPGCNNCADAIDVKNQKPLCVINIDNTFILREKNGITKESCNGVLGLDNIPFEIIVFVRPNSLLENPIPGEISGVLTVKNVKPNEVDQIKETILVKINGYWIEKSLENNTRYYYSAKPTFVEYEDNELNIFLSVSVKENNF